MNYSSPQVVSLAVATTYSMKEIVRLFRANTDVQTLFFRDVLFVQMGSDDLGGQRGAFIFPYGALVMWALSEEEQAQLIETLHPYEENSYESYEKESISFAYGTKQEIVDDTLTLSSSHITIKLALSHGLAQSVKLSFFESIIKKTIDTK